MSPEVELLYETWDKIKTYISKKDKIHVAEELVRTFENTIGLDEIETELNSFDSVMKAALMSHLDLGYEDDEEDDEDWD
jgi:hypothetical protein